VKTRRTPYAERTSVLLGARLKTTRHLSLCAFAPWRELVFADERRQLTPRRKGAKTERNSGILERNFSFS
jgi:hypothetical protein